MEPRLYAHIVSIIDKYRTWIKVDNTNTFVKKFIVVDGKLVQSCTRVLSLKSFAVRWGFVQPRIWHISIADLNKGVNSLCVVKQGARQRIKSFELTLYDVEYIVEIATDGIVKLGLGKYGLR